MILSRQLVSNNEGGKTMKEKLNAFIEDFKKEALLDVIKIELSSKPTVGITQSKVGGHFYLPKSACIPTNDKGEQLMFLTQLRRVARERYISEERHRTVLDFWW